MAEIALRNYVAEIETLIEGSSYDEAIAHCRHILTQQPKYLEAYRLLAKASLEKEDHTAAADIFQRVLSVDPEDFIARVGLSIAYDRQGKLDEALWQMERGFELQPSNDVVQSELKRLYSRRDGVEPGRIGLTRGALARMYAQGDLYTEAIAELRALLKEAPDRVDLQMLLAEVLWRDEQRSEAADMAERVLGKLPHCLNANLLLGEIWLNGGFQADGETHLRRAQAVDPDNLRAAAVLRPMSPLAEQTTAVTRLEYYAQPVAAAPEAVTDQVPDWLAGLAGLTIEQPESAGAPALPEPASAPAIELGPAAGEAELPAWLFEGAPAETAEAAQPTTEGEASDWMRTLMDQAQAAEATQVEAPEAAPAPEPAAGEGLPDWMRVLSEQVQPPAAPVEAVETRPTEPAIPTWLSDLGVTTEAPEAPAAEAPTPDWLSEVTAAPAPTAAQPEAGLPDWLTDLGVTPPPAKPAEAPTAGLEQAELPDWLQSLRPPEPEPAAPAPQVEVPEVEESEIPEWLAATQEAPATDEAIDFLERLGETAQIEPEAPPTIVAAAPAFDVEPKHVPPTSPEPAAPPPMPMPEAMPSADEALAFLQSLTFGKEEELRTQAEIAGEMRMEAIMGGKPGSSPLRPRPEAAQPEPAAPTPSEPVTAPPAAVPEGMPSADEALAFLQSFTVGKEEELRAQAEREGETRMEEIMGGKPGTSPLRPKREAAQPEPAAPALPVEEMPAEPSYPESEFEAAPITEVPAEELAEALAFEAPEAALDFETDLAFLQSLEVGEVEAPSEAPLGLAEELPVVDYWLQTAVDEGAEPIAPDYFKPKPKPAPRAAGPKPKKVRPAERVEPERVIVPEAAAVTLPGAGEFVSRLQANPSDWEALLGMARVWWASGERDQSLPLYQRLIEREQFLPEVAADLERSLEAFDGTDWYRALGDAHMKLGNLSQALEAYRQALTHL